MSNSEQCSNRLELYIISLLANFSYELGQIMARFDFLWPRWVNLNNVQTDSQLDLISIFVNFSCELGQIGGSFQKKNPKWGPKNLIRFILLWFSEKNVFFCNPKLSHSSRFWWYSFVSSSFIFGQFPVARKLIINGGAIRPTGLLLVFPSAPNLCSNLKTWWSLTHRVPTLICVGKHNICVGKPWNNFDRKPQN